jgi:alginate O-acetyltransferase complex protein AlgI
LSFNSVDFLLFFPAVALLYYVLPARFRWVLLLAASYYFYAAWQPAYALLIGTATLVSYAAALLTARTSRRAGRLAPIAVATAVILGMLVVFKYYGFFMGALADLLEPLGITITARRFDLLLPVGISFYTFQTLGYLFDVYRGQKEAERHLGRFALFVSFFPQLVAGPIETADHLMPQLARKHDFDTNRIISGLRRVLWGMFKKVVIADSLAVVVEHIYALGNRPATEFEGPLLVVGTVLFAFQIYADFSAYSDIAIGAARILGIDLVENFRFPYHAGSIVDFWRRWHISLYRWFREYVYFPLGGSRVGRLRRYRNIMIVFLVSGLWHGAAWNFVIWGGIHGLYLVGADIFRRGRSSSTAAGPFVPATGTSRFRPSTLVAVPLTFALVCFAWIFFRADDLGQAMEIIRRLPSGWDFSLQPGLDARFSAILNLKATAYWRLLPALLLLVEPLGFGIGRVFARRHPFFTPIRWAYYAALLWGILNMGTIEEIPFVYFQF